MYYLWGVIFYKLFLYYICPIKTGVILFFIKYEN